MPKFKRSEFAELCGVTNGYLKNYINRGSLIEDDDGGFTVDHLHRQNELFYEKRKNGVKLRPTEKTKPAKQKQNVVAPKQKVSSSNRIPRDFGSGQVTEGTQMVLQLDRKKKEADLEAAELNIEIKKIELAKKRGEVIPTDLATTVFRNHFKSVTKAFHQGANNFIATIAKRAGIPKDDLADLRGELIEIVNDSVKDAAEDSKADIDNIVKEYAAKRGVGQSR